MKLKVWLRCKILGHQPWERKMDIVCLQCGTTWPRDPEDTKRWIAQQQGKQ